MMRIRQPLAIACGTTLFWTTRHWTSCGIHPKVVRRQIGRRLETLAESFQGDVKKLEGQKNRYRLRVGSYRVLFRLDGPVIHVYAVKQRKEAYG